MSQLMRLYTNHISSFALADELCPGICRLETVPSFAFKWENRSGANETGSKKFYKGRELAKFTFEIQLYDDDDLDRFEEWLNKFSYAPDAPEGVDAFAIAHPVVNAWGVHLCVMADCKAPKLDEGKNLYFAYVELEEVRDPKPVTVAAKAGPFKADGAPSGEEQDPVLAAIAAQQRAANDENARLKRDRQAQLDADKGARP